MDYSGGKPDINGYLFKSLDFKLGSVRLTPNYLQAVLIVITAFVLVFMLARMRHMYVHWSMKGLVPSIIFGLLVSLIIEGVVIVSGHTLLTELLKWENAPKPISTALDEGRSRLFDVLGKQTEFSMESGSLTSDTVIDAYYRLSEKEKEKVLESIK